jgi:hypothetical protein
VIDSILANRLLGRRLYGSAFHHRHALGFDRPAGRDRPLSNRPCTATTTATGDEATSDCNPAAAARVGVLETLVTKQRTYIKALEARIRHLQGH